jgi:hypothetical protein
MVKKSWMSMRWHDGALAGEWPNVGVANSGESRSFLRAFFQKSAAF